MKIFRLFKKYPPRSPPPSPLPHFAAVFREITERYSGAKSTSPTFCSLLAQTVDRRVCLCKWQTRLVIFVKNSLRTRDLTNFGIKLHDPVCPLLSKAWSASKHNVHDRKDKKFQFHSFKTNHI